jgi:hypothetical protein
MNPKNWYFLGFGSLVAWVFFLSQAFCTIYGVTTSGFDLLLNLIFEGGSFLSTQDHVPRNVIQAIVVTLLFLGLAYVSFKKGRGLESDDGE